MPTHLEGVFEVTSWNEEPVGGLEGTAKVTAAGIGQRFSGGIEADTKWDMVMTYRDDGTADFVGYQRLDGRIGDKSGTFVLQGIGEFDGTEARTRLQVVPGCSTGDLSGLRGTGLAVAPRGSTGTYSLDYDL
ncbi:MAG TPA: DUF3224 domain-containing protein [Acidimicrobiales bacterium]|nr:DUF3224 domain-containing protein [Acidimicrobiales bacterium]